MENVPHVCGFIPRHVLDHVASHDRGRAAADARATLDQMHGVFEDRCRSLIPPVPSASTRRKRRNVYDAGHRRTLPGKLVISDTKRSTDRDAVEAYDGAGKTHDFFAQRFGRESIDGHGQRIDSTVHYGVRFANAMWNGRQIIYGDGDGRFFGRFTGALDVVAHELTHGVTQNTAGLVYEGESGALNEHFSDAFGSMVKQFYADQTAEQADWLIGKGVLAASVNGVAIRSMAAPGTAYDDPILGKDPQPSHMRDYVRGADDNGGIHINSGILNHAFYQAATMIGGWTWTVLGPIWWETLKNRLEPQAGFQQFADTTTRVAGELFGFGDRVQLSLVAAWARVGLPTRSDVLVPPRKNPPVPESILAVQPPATASHLN